MRPIVCVLLVTTLFSCQTGKNKTVALYNADSLITTQVAYLSQHKARLHKITKLGDIESEAATIPNSVKDWENELDIFRQLESVNKPVNRRLYAVERSSDVKSNLEVKSFIGQPELGKKEVEMPVKYLKVFYQNTPDNIRKIEAQYDESNTLYTGSRFLKMEFQQVYNKTVLTSYSITGGQKMFMGDSVSYNISAFVTIPN
ncbi:hypothetical protein [Chryseolinea soli]|uniref:hypothetical protein n=1 Tax=Chryseolinea soli TaxID=2321403 RepID=UPI0013594C5C|nr:hypothetical protein [Chryseolinea soli]